MLQTTFDRMAGLVSSEHVLVLTNQQLSDAVVSQLPDLPLEHVIGEPFKRDTAPCIGVAASLVQAADKDGIMVVMLRITLSNRRQSFIARCEPVSNWSNKIRLVS